MTVKRPWTSGSDEDYPGHPGEHPWRFGHCNRCDVRTWPVGLCPGIWRWRIEWRWHTWRENRRRKRALHRVETAESVS